MIKIDTGSSPHFTLIHKPVIVEIFPTMKCNVNCPYCDRGKEDSELEAFDDITDLLENLRTNDNFSFHKFRVTGREPTLYPRINELIAFLKTLDTKNRIDFLSNGLNIAVLKNTALASILLGISIYPQTQKALNKNEYFQKLLAQKYPMLVVNIITHEDLTQPGTKRNAFNPFSDCFSPTLLCATKRVYPCCRAHLYEQMHNQKYHVSIKTPDIYSALQSIIQTTNLCMHCPRVYTNPTKKPVT